MALLRTWSLLSDGSFISTKTLEYSIGNCEVIWYCIEKLRNLGYLNLYEGILYLTEKGRVIFSKMSKVADNIVKMLLKSIEEAKRKYRIYGIPIFEKGHLYLIEPLVYSGDIVKVLERQII